MKMLLRDLTFVELASMLKRHENASSVPHLVDPESRERARQTARENGVWEQITEELDPTRAIPVLKRSSFRQFKRNGNRSRNLAVESARSRELELAAGALWLDHPAADLDYLQDLLWAYCDDWTWILAAHEYTAVDLGAAVLAARLAEICRVFREQIETEVSDRVHAEIEKRVFRNVVDYRNTEFWHTARMNWNHVCNGSVVRAALLVIEQPRVLARFIHPCIQNMTYAFDGFTDDGGCEEGAGYWGYGFGHFVQAAYALHCRTAGELNLMADEKIARIARFPLAAHIDGKYRAGFADCRPGTVNVMNALQINHFFDLPELYELCPRSDTGKASGKGPLQVQDMHSLGLYCGEEALGTPDSRDFVLPDMGMVKMRGSSGPDQMTVAAIAGNNGVPHSHNDVGSFMVYKNGRMRLTDPGGPEYTDKTFSDKRYEILYCRSRGHSVPIINGCEQQAGTEFYGDLTVEGCNQQKVKRAVIDMTHAYPRGTVKQLNRTLELDSEANALVIKDAFCFDDTPQNLEEAFVTFETAEVNAGGNAVRIGPDGDTVTLSVEQAGVFYVETLADESEAARPGGPPLRRICFVPDQLAKELTLAFRIS